MHRPSVAGPAEGGEPGGHHLGQAVLPGASGHSGHLPRQPLPADRGPGGRISAQVLAGAGVLCWRRAVPSAAQRKGQWHSFTP